MINFMTLGVLFSFNLGNIADVSEKNVNSDLVDYEDLLGEKGDSLQHFSSFSMVQLISPSISEMLRFYFGEDASMVKVSIQSTKKVVVYDNWGCFWNLDPTPFIYRSDR